MELGYDKIEWNAELSHTIGMYDDYYWKDLPFDIQQAWAVLGYTETKWNFDLPVALPSWAGLSVPQRDAATELGYDQESWDDSA